ncbi:PepSY-associated TM helix domain-containing protein [Nocardioides acrostichi]|uniref:PepSY domain-containing protein n=1 Tax=Nocardioides acrostichi TaxID=2784339 RepID=A0A930V0E4_9ACTN|nr:PepSY domain-containing protein [Nocardioides acrostichi]MBF4161415.1 PepSY domain-containing protein [Nocardioides acrostichi]
MTTDLSTPDHSPPVGTHPRRTAPSDRATKGGLFRAVWRWHFFASFLVVPVLLVLATTGLIYLLRFQIEPLLHADLMRVDVPSDTQAAATTKTYDTQLEAVRSAYPGATVESLTEPGAADEPTRFTITTADGGGRDVFVDPYDGRVLGSLNPETTLSGYAVRLHANLMAGRLGDTIMEIGACWAIVMALTGYYLFVRGRRARRRQARAARRGARLRTRHATVGLVVGVGLLYLLVSGLPWTGFWGAQVQSLATDRGSSLWSTDPGAVSDPTSTLDESLPHSHTGTVPWGMEDSEVPQSERTDDGSVANIETAVAVAGERGLRHPFTIALPSEDLADPGVYSVIGYAFDAPSDERTVHVDRYGGQVVSTYGFDDYPLLAKVVSHGIGLHEGRSWGLWSFWGAALMCVAVMFMCVTGPLMWWRRRPRGSGRLGAPRGRMPLRATPALLVGFVALGVFLPLFGLSLVVVLALDQLVLRRVTENGRSDPGSRRRHRRRCRRSPPSARVL